MLNRLVEDTPTFVYAQTLNPRLGFNLIRVYQTSEIRV